MGFQITFQSRVPGEGSSEVEVTSSSPCIISLPSVRKARRAGDALRKLGRYPFKSPSTKAGDQLLLLLMITLLTCFPSIAQDHMCIINQIQCHFRAPCYRQSSYHVLHISCTFQPKSGQENLFKSLTDAELDMYLDLRMFMQRCPYVIPASASLSRTYRLFRYIVFALDILRCIPV